MGPRSILIIGNYGAGNLGDDAILGGIVTELRSIGFAGEIQVTYGGVQSSSEIYKGLKKVPFLPVGLRSRFKKNRKEALGALKRADLVILGGGGLFVDSESWRAPFIWAGQAAWCRKLKKPYLCYGQSVGPLKHWWSRRLTRRTFKNALAVHVRDENSAKQVKKWKIPCTVGTDPAFSWLLEEKRPIPRKPVLLLSLREWPGFKQTEELVKEIKVFCRHKNLKPILISMDVHEKLDTFGMEIYRPESALAAFEAFEKSQMAVTMRLHAGIFAVTAGTPLIALSYSEKVKGMLQDKATVLSGKELSGESLRNSLKNLKNAKNINLEEALTTNADFLSVLVRGEPPASFHQ